MSSDNVLVAVAIVTLIVSVAAAGFVYSSIHVFKNTWFTGFATSTGIVNLTVESSAAINFTTNNISFGSGRVTAGATNASLVTGTSSSTITNGNWSTLPASFVLENIGNVNVSINLTTGKTAATFIGGSNPLYQFNVTDKSPGSCLNYTGTGADANINTTRDAPGSTTTLICGTFPFSDTQDEIRIGLRLVIPSDSQTGALGDIITVSTIPV